MSVRDELRERLAIEVRPGAVAWWGTSELPLVKEARRRAAHQRLPRRLQNRQITRTARRHPFVLDQDAFPTPLRLEDHQVYRWVDDLIANRTRPQQTVWYEHMVASLAIHGPTSYQGWPITRPEDAQAFIQRYFLPLVDAIERDGFRTDLTPDLGFALIGATGEVLKTKQATHRFFIARSLGLERFPLRVSVVHATWWRSVFPEVAGLRQAPPPDWPPRLEAALRTVAERHR